MRTWHTRKDGTRRVSGRSRSPGAFGGGLLLVVVGVGLATAGTVLAAERPNSLGIHHTLAVYFGAPGAAGALVGGGLLWLGWPIRVRAEALSQYPGLGEPPPPLPPLPIVF